MTTQKILPILNKKLASELARNKKEIKALSDEYNRIKQTVAHDKESMRKIEQQLTVSKKSNTFVLLSRKKDTADISLKKHLSQLKTIQDQKNEKLSIAKSQESKQELISERLYFDSITEKELREEKQQEEIAELFTCHVNELPLSRIDTRPQNEHPVVKTNVEITRILPDSVTAKMVSSIHDSIIVQASAVNNHGVGISVVAKQESPFQKISSNKKLLSEDLLRHDIDVTYLCIDQGGK